MLAADPDTTGSLGMAIFEAVERAAGDPNTHYALGSVLNHVLLHQSVIGVEALAQPDEIGESADIVFGCSGGGSNLAGLSFPFIGHDLRDGSSTRVVACEPSACPSLTQREYRYDHGDLAGLNPRLKMHTLGRTSSRRPLTPADCATTAWRPWSRMPTTSGCSRPSLSIRTTPSGQASSSPAPRRIIPAPESTHAIAGALAHARAATTDKTIVIGLSGKGLLELPAYDSYV